LQNPTTTPSGRISNEPEEERSEREREKKCHVAMFMPAAKGSARTPLGPTCSAKMRRCANPSRASKPLACIA
jgi:hypothetical protein